MFYIPWLYIFSGKGVCPPRFFFGNTAGGQSLSLPAAASSLCTRELNREPPLMVRGGVERSETEGIRRLVLDKTNRKPNGQSPLPLPPFAQGGCRDGFPLLHKGVVVGGLRCRSLHKGAVVGVRLRRWRPLMLPRGRTERHPYASPYGKGRGAHLFMPPLMVRGGVERSETEGIRGIKTLRTVLPQGIFGKRAKKFFYPGRAGEKNYFGRLRRRAAGYI